MMRLSRNIRQNGSSGKLKQLVSLGFLLLLPIIFTVTFQKSWFSARAESSVTYSPRVLAIGFNPTNTATNAAETYFSRQMGNRTASQTEEYVFNGAIDAFKRISNNTINYQIAHKITLTEFPRYTNGQTYTMESYRQCVYSDPSYNPTYCEQQKVTFDHQAWLADNNICGLVEQYNIDEVWVLSLPYVMTWESFMFGPRDGFWVNGPYVTTDACNKNIILMDGTYDAPNNFLHSYGHRLESIMVYLSENWQDADKKKYWDDFASWDNRSEGDYTVPTCGNTHWPANALMGYDYGNTRTLAFTCPDWQNFPNLTGATVTIDCRAWGCMDKGWQEYWFSALPRSDGEVQLTAKGGNQFTIRRNWWHYILYPENAIAQKKAQFSFSDTYSASLRGDLAVFYFPRNEAITQYHIDVSLKSNMSQGVYLNFAQGVGSPLTVANPQDKWDKYRCGNTLYWRVSNIERTINSPIQRTTIICDSPTPTPILTTIPVDTTPPSISITSPATGAVVTRNKATVIAATAADTSGINRVEFFVNGVLQCTDMTTSYTCSWKVPPTRNENYTLTAKAFDMNGNSSTHTITVRSSN